MRHTLQLNADYTPMKLLSWQKAIELVLTGRAITVEPWGDRYIRSERLAVPWPAVVALRRYRPPRGRIGFSARGVMARDLWTCAYCGLQPRLMDGRPDRRALTLDHVIPRAQSKRTQGTVYLPWSRVWVAVTSWENTTTSCGRCNVRKADRTPVEAGMALRTLPRAPTRADILRMELERVSPVPTAWRPYLPAGWSAGRADEEDPRVTPELLLGAS